MEHLDLLAPELAVHQRQGIEGDRTTILVVRDRENGGVESLGIARCRAIGEIASRNGRGDDSLKVGDDSRQLLGRHPAACPLNDAYTHASPCRDGLVEVAARSVAGESMFAKSQRRDASAQVRACEMSRAPLPGLHPETARSKSGRHITVRHSRESGTRLKVRHSRASGNPWSPAQNQKMDPRLRGDDERWPEGG